jgi:hypothetical protein
MTSEKALSSVLCAPAAAFLEAFGEGCCPVSSRSSMLLPLSSSLPSVLLSPWNTMPLIVVSAIVTCMYVYMYVCVLPSPWNTVPLIVVSAIVTYMYLCMYVCIYKCNIYIYMHI